MKTEWNDFPFADKPYVKRIYINASLTYCNEIKERLIRTLQAELPNEKWDRIQQIVEGNFEMLLRFTEKIRLKKP